MRESDRDRYGERDRGKVTSVTFTVNSRSTSMR